MRRVNFIAIASIALAVGLSSPARANYVTNGGFEIPSLPTSSSLPNTQTQCTGSLPCYLETSEGNVPGWQTTAGPTANNAIEIWTSGFGGGGISTVPVPAYQGNQFTELNSSDSFTLYQDITGIPVGTRLISSFAHRGRDGIDVVNLEIFDNNVSVFSQNYSTGDQAWSNYLTPTFLASGNTIRLAFTPISAAGGAARGNFVDAVNLREETPGPLPLLGASTAFAFSRKLRSRIRRSSV